MRLYGDHIGSIFLENDHHKRKCIPLEAISYISKQVQLYTPPSKSLSISVYMNFVSVDNVPWEKEYFTRRLPSKFRYKILLNFDVKRFEDYSFSFITSHLVLT